MKLILKIAFSFLLLGLSQQLYSQSTIEKNDSTSANTLNSTSQNPEVEELDTEESIKYMGDQLLFQLRRRLNLTTEEEEKEKSKNKKKAVLNILGVKIERN